ncbi:hypothetical protein QFX17_04590 [Lactobacillus helveticus]|uniref:hypothetical protein n=1 Tax=Lactobacillus helveticus TaxID=1587 RepID=UPI001565B2F7|nr:hypothetical protein [Lactobacillus helveticus]MDN6039403.1 hypothetical protein [Lactobacillus sp.]MCO0807254.1 hypothetical protein [Lactobacillus helveticus]MCP9316988.1 hypothetical protein [Lactobacillus helveticus]MDH5817543.1 hypothetical protein [Lactobacillus helveticus]NRO75881.1 hypothetical protein [Lactobacillus helveticus]
MSFLGIVTLVLIALIILSLLFVFFKAFILLLQVALIAIAVIWLIGWFTGRKNKNNMPSSGNYYDWFKNVNSTQSQTRARKKAKNVTTKDIDK